MRQYRIDELRPNDYEKIKGYLEEHFASSQMEGVYWIPLDADLLNEVQATHTECQPFYFIIDLKPDRLSGEFLIRTKNRIRCDCIGYAIDRQRDWVLKSIDALFAKLKIKT